MPSELEVKYQTPSQPRQLRLDTTTTCNAKCLSCHRFLSDRQGQMPMELFNQILDDVSKWERPLEEIIPVNYGEFLTHPKRDYILEAIARKLPHTHIVLPTNGCLMTDSAIKLIASIPTIQIVNFSVNAFFAETYEMFTALPAKTLDTIEKAVRQLKILRPDITLWCSMVFDPSYSSDLERDLFMAKWSQIAVPQILPAASAGRPGQEPYAPLRIPCRSIFSDIVVGFDGKLSSCCFDSAFSLDIGMYEGDLLKAWKNPKLEALRKLHNEHHRYEADLCERCTFA